MKSKIYIWLISLCLMSQITAMPASVFNGDKGKNWIIEMVYQNADTDGNFDSIPFRINYFDGLGRRVQTVEGALNSSRNGIVDFVQYDSRGRNCRQWLPAQSTDRQGSYTPLDVMTDTYANPLSASQQSIYELSPSGRIIKSVRPGMATVAADKGVTTQYLFNTKSGEYACLRLRVKEGKLFCYGFYDAGQLQVIAVTDESGNKTIEFTDCWGQSVLTRSISSVGTTADTYHAYDGHGRLCAEISPKGSLLLKAGGQLSLSDKQFAALAHVYEYDNYGRVKRVYVPGGGSKLTAYTGAGQACFSQNSIQAENDTWDYQAFDGLGRPAYKGTFRITSGEPVESFGNNHKTLFNPDDENSIFGYKKAFSWEKAEDCIAADFYDDYRFLDLFPEISHLLKFSNSGEYDNRGDVSGSTFSPKGHLTGSVRRIISPDNNTQLIVSAYYYDEKGRLIHTVSTNHLGGYDATYTSLTFDGRVSKSRTVHSTLDKSLSVTRIFAYDCLGTPIAEAFKTANSQITLISETDFDMLHRPSALHMLNGELSVNYSYTPEGMLNSIESVPFSQTLWREIRPDGSTGCLNGSICAQDFRLATTSPELTTPSTTGVEARYDYEYDGIRLLSAKYTELSRRVAVPTLNRWLPDQHHNPNYSSIYKYDVNGNIISLIRFGMSEQQVIQTSVTLKRYSQNRYIYNAVDDLTLEYEGNRLIKVTDEAEDPEYASANDFQDGANSSVEYTYDSLGRLTSDLNKGITSIKYNVIGLPSDIYANSGHIRISYDADGNMLSKQYGFDAIKIIEPTNPLARPIYTTEFQQSSSLDWCGGCEYVDGKFSRMFHSAGWFDSNAKHTAVVKDYQGNVRASWTQGQYVTGLTLDSPSESSDRKLYANVTGYYPYGLPWSNLQGTDRYLFSGKELDRNFDLLLYDFHARLYDPQTGRFMQPDPLSGTYPGESPWLYCAANPIMCTDPTGMVVINIENPDERIDGTNILVGLNVSNSDFQALKSTEQIYNERFEALFDELTLKYGFHISGCFNNGSLEALCLGVRAGTTTYSEWLIDNYSVFGAILSEISPFFDIAADVTKGALNQSDTRALKAALLSVNESSLSKIVSPKTAQYLKYTSFGVGLTSSLVNLLTAFSLDDYRCGYKTQLTFWKELGSWVGGYAGSYVGREIGVGIGTPGGPVGEAIGGTVGGIIGSFIGSKLGEKISTSIFRDYMTK